MCTVKLYQEALQLATSTSHFTWRKTSSSHFTRSATRSSQKLFTFMKTFSYYGERCRGNHYTIFSTSTFLSHLCLLLLSQMLSHCSLMRTFNSTHFALMYYTIYAFYSSFCFVPIFVFYSFLSISYCIIKERTFGLVSTYLHLTFPLQFSKSRNLHIIILISTFIHHIIIFGLNSLFT